MVRMIWNAARIYAIAVLLAIAPRVALGQTTNYSIPVGVGTLAYQEVVSTGTCPKGPGSQHGGPPMGPWTESNFTSFSYTAPGVSQSLSGSTEYMSSPGGSYGCPANGWLGANPLVLTAPTFTITFTPSLTGAGSAIIAGVLPQTISFTAPATPITYTTNTIALSASASSGLPIIFSVSGPATISGSTLTLTGAGSVTVTAAQPGNTSYAAAISVPKSISVSMASPSVTVICTPNPILYTSYSTCTATVGGVSGDIPTGSVTWTFATPSINNGNPVSMGSHSLSGGSSSVSIGNNNVGSYTISATYSGDAGNNSSSKSTTVQLNPAPQTITFTALPTQVVFGLTPLELSATGGGSGNPVTFSIVSGPGAVINGNELNLTGAGTIVVAANQAGSTNYAAAPTVTQTVIVQPTTALLSLTTSGTPSTPTAPITLTANLGWGPDNPELSELNSGGPTGTVTFIDTYNGVATTLGTGTVISNGTGVNNPATLTIALPFGAQAACAQPQPTCAHSITARWAGSANFYSVTSASITQMVVPALSIQLSAAIQ